MQRKGRQSIRLWIAMAAALIASLAIAACGSSSTESKNSSSEGDSTPTSESSEGGGSSASLTQYEQEVEAAQSPVKWEGPTESAPAPSGKTITVVTCTEALEGCKLLTESSVEAAEKIGWTAHVINVTETNKYDQAVQTAVAQGSEAIILVGVDQRLISSGLKAAHAKNIPLVSVFQYNEPGPEGVNVEVSPNASVEGKLLADAMIVNTKGNVNVMFMPDSEFSLPVHVLAAAKKQLEECSACTVKFAPELNFTASTVGTTLPGRVVAAMQKEPSINSILVGYDPPATQIIPALDAAKLQENVKMYSQLGTTAALSFIAEENVLAADIGASNSWGGWGAVDETIRLLDKQPTVNEKIPSILLNSSNLPAKGQPFVGDYAHFKEKYEELWK